MPLRPVSKPIIFMLFWFKCHPYLIDLMNDMQCIEVPLRAQHRMPRDRLGRYAVIQETDDLRPRFNRRGSIRPQQGQTYLCARALERGWILPPRNLETLHQSLYEKGLAAPFGQPLPVEFTPAIDELNRSVIAAAGKLSIALATPAPSQTRPLSRHEQRLEHS